MFHHCQRFVRYSMFPLVTNYTSNLVIQNEKKLDENRVPTPVFDDLLDPDANLPDLELRDTEKLKM